MPLPRFLRIGNEKEQTGTKGNERNQDKDNDKDKDKDKDKDNERVRDTLSLFPQRGDIYISSHGREKKDAAGSQYIDGML